MSLHDIFPLQNSIQTLRLGDTLQAFYLSPPVRNFLLQGIAFLCGDGRCSVV